MKQQEELNQYPIIDSNIEEWYCYGDSLCVKGKYNKTKDRRNDKGCYYNLYFSNIKNSNIINREGKNYPNAKVVKFEVNEIDSGFDVCLIIYCGSEEIDFFNNEETLKKVEALETIEVFNNIDALDNIEVLRLCCEDMYYDIFKYRGMSYENVYLNPQYQALFTENRQAYGKDEYFLKASSKDLENGYMVQWDSYGECRRAKNGVLYKNIFIQRCHLLCEKTVLFEYDSIYDMGHVSAIIKHQNGKSYFLFKTDLYGLNVYDMQSKDVFYYVPEGYQHSYQQICGESFIITAIHYDDKTNWIAYEGCYWGGPCDVMIGDFSNPMNFNPILKSIHERIDPEYDYYDNVDFDKWENGKLYVIVDGKKDIVEPIKIRVDE